MYNAQYCLRCPFAPCWSADPKSERKVEQKHGERKTHLLGFTKGLRNAPNKFTPSKNFEAGENVFQPSSNILQISFTIVAPATAEVASAGRMISRREGDIVAYCVNGWKDYIGAFPVVFKIMVVAVQSKGDRVVPVEI